MMDLLALIDLARARSATDLHLVVGLPPAVHVHGSIVTLALPALVAEDIRGLLEPHLDEPGRVRLEAERGLCLALLDGPARRARVTAYFQAGALELAIRLCASEVGDRESLGLPPVIDPLARLSHGLVLVCGHNGCGKSTTLNYLIDLINRERNCKVVTIEDPVEFVHRPRRSLIVQQEIPGDVPSFPRALVQALRQGADVIVVGEMRDPETIATALDAAESGHLVLSTLHTSGVVQSIDRLTGVFSPERQRQVVLQLATVLQAVVVQQLVPRLDGRGRVLAAEVLVANPGVRSLIRSGKLAQLPNAIQTGRREGMQTMDASLMDLYRQGRITLDEAQARQSEVQFHAPPATLGAQLARPDRHEPPVQLGNGGTARSHWS